VHPIPIECSNKRQGVVRKRLLPIVQAAHVGSKSAGGNNTNTHQFAPLSVAAISGLLNSSTSESNVVSGPRIESGQSVVVTSEATVAATAAADGTGTSSSSASAGEVVSTSASGDIGVALVRLTDVLAIDGQSAAAAGGGAGTGVVTRSLKCTKTVDTAAAPSDASDETAVEAVISRPSWWLDIDPVTGKRVDTLDNTTAAE
jgi:hypothetical protein